jgi:hypothetical protein
MPVCGLFQVLRALEILGNFTGAAMHTPLPRWSGTTVPTTVRFYFNCRHHVALP